VAKPPDRQKMAEELVSARLWQSRQFVPKPNISSDLANDAAGVQHDLMVELYLTHYSNEQLRTLLEFYRSPAGQSIIDTDRIVHDEFRREMPDRLKTFFENASLERLRKLQSDVFGSRSGPLPTASSSENAPKLAEATGSPSETPFRIPTRWRIEIRAFSGPDFEFKGALGHDGELELIETSTPFDKTFTGTGMIGLFQAPKGHKLRVASYFERDGQYLPHASFGSRAGKLIFDASFQAYGAGSL
jgi:Uncharacterized protein conserved in bacteria (DUF2059)